MSAGYEIGRALRDVWDITFVDPVREGRPHPRGWPRGLAAVGVAAMVVYVLLTAAAMLAVPLRQAGELTVSTTSDHTLPTVTLPLLLTGVILSFALAHTATLHTTWWLRIPLFLVGAAATTFFTSAAYDRPLLILASVLAYLGLLVFTIVRSRRAEAWWEFWVVTAFVSTAALLPWVGGGSYGVDLRPMGLEGAIVNLQAFALPAIIVAATAPAQIVVTGAVAASTRPVGRGVFWVGGSLILLWFGFSLTQAGEELEASSLIGATICLATVAAALAVVLGLGGRGRPAPPEDYPETWGPWLYPLATAMMVMTVVLFPLVLVRAAVAALGLGDSAVGQLTDLVWYGWFENNPGVIWRALIGIVTLFLAVRASRGGRTGEAGFLVAFAATVLLDAAALQPGAAFLLDRNPVAYGAIAGGLALVLGGWFALRRQLTRTRAAGVFTVLLLAVLYPHRDVLSDPASAVLVFSGPLLILFGLTWRLVTDAEFTREGSRLFPQSTRVLLYLANSLFAVTLIAFMALARGTGTNIDTSQWSYLGESVLGDPLFVVALVAGVWLIVDPRRTGRSDPSGRPPASITVASAAGIPQRKPNLERPSDP